MSASMACSARPFSWLYLSLLLTLVCTAWLFVSSLTFDVVTVHRLKKRPPKDGQWDVILAAVNCSIIWIRSLSGKLGSSSHWYSSVSSLISPTFDAQSQTRKILEDRKDADRCFTFRSSDVSQCFNVLKRCSVADQETRTIQAISIPKQDARSSSLAQEIPERKISKVSLSQDGEELLGVVSILLQRKKGVRNDLRKNLLPCMAMLVVCWTLFLLTGHATLETYDQVIKNVAKFTSEVWKEDLSLAESGYEPRHGLGVKNWRKASTDSALRRLVLLHFERSCGSFPFLSRLSKRHDFLPGSTTFWVAPASQQFLPTVLGNEGNRFQYTGYRLASLAALPSSCPISPLRLAEAGFHYNPKANKSAVICHECGARYSWGLPSATRVPPLLYHQTVSPNCSVVLPLVEVYGSSSATTLTGVSLQRQTHLGDDVQTDGPAEAPPAARATSLTSNETDRQRTSNMAPVTDQLDGYTLALPNTSLDVQSSAGTMAVSSASASSGSGEKVILDLNSAVYPLYSSLQSRLATFSKWPASNFRPPEILAPLGFFYAGYADCVRCFYCGIGLKTWEENDDPEEEHIRWRPNCQFVLATKGRRFVDTTLARINRRSNSDDDVPDQSNPARDSHRDTSRSGENQTREAGDNSRATLSSEDLQQLLQMGFSTDMIRSAQERLLRAGQTLNIDNMLGFLVP